MHVELTYVEFHFANGSVSKRRVDDRNIEHLEIPEGIVRYRFYDTSISTPVGIAAFNFIPKEKDPFNYSEFFTVAKAD